MAAQRTIIIESTYNGTTYETEFENVNPTGDASQSSVAESLRSAFSQVMALSNNTTNTYYVMDKINITG